MKTKREELLDKRLDKIVEKTNANQRVFAMRTAMAELKRSDLTPDTYRYLFGLFSNELGNVAMMLSDIWWLASQREKEAVEGTLDDLPFADEAGDSDA